jgi:hypothetical protein
MSDESDRPYPPTLSLHGRRRLLLGLSVAPLAWLVHLVASYAVVGPSCTMSSPWLLHTALTIGALAIAVPGGVTAFRTLRSAADTPVGDRANAGNGGAGGESLAVSERDARSTQRDKLFAAIALANATLFSAIIVLAWTASLVVSPCAP